MRHARPSSSARRRAALLESIEPRRLMAAAIDNTFAGDGVANIPVGIDSAANATTAVGADGKITTVVEIDGAIEGSFLVRRFLANGTPDSSFSSDGEAQIFVEGLPADADITLEDVAVAEDGSVLLGYVFSDYFAQQDVLRVSRVTAAGQLDGNWADLGYQWGYVGVGETGLPNATDLSLTTDGDALYAAFVDRSFNDDMTGFDYVGKVIKSSVASGQRDTSFGVNGTYNFIPSGEEIVARDVIVEESGRILVIGTAFADVYDPTSFGIFATAINAGGVGGVTTETYSLGTPEFSYAGAVASPDGDGFVAAGTKFAYDPDTGTASYSPVLLDVRSDLSIDTDGLGFNTYDTGTDFRTSTSASYGQLAIDGLGRAYLAGATGQVGELEYQSTVASAVLRINADGTIDTSFGANGIHPFAEDAVFSTATNVTATADGGVVVTNVVDGEPQLYKVESDVTEEPPVDPIPFSLTNGVLSYVAGADDTTNDVISVTKNASGAVVFTLNGTSYVVDGNVTGIRIDGGAGNDLIKISGAITAPATLVGGAGNDSLRGGSGDDVLLGGDGDDALVGRDGQDFLLGGTGKDYLVGREDADVLISGTTTLNQAGIDAVMKEWTSNHNVLVKIANVSGLLPLANRLNGNSYLTPGVTIFNDTSIDTLSGGDGTDFYYAQLFGSSADVINDNMRTYRADVSALVFND